MQKIKNSALTALVIIGVSGGVLLGARAQVRERREKKAVMMSTIAFVSTRHAPPPGESPLHASQIYLMDGDGSNVRRLTENAHMDNFPALSPDGSRIVFDSNRLRTAGEPFNTSDLFVMNVDGTAQTPLVRGNSATWSPDGKRIAFHASASGTGRLVSALPGAAATDSDLFVLSVDDFLKKGARPKNITNNQAAVDDDPDWSPAGGLIVFTSHATTDDHNNAVTTEVYVTDPDRKGKPVRLTDNAEEERAPSWSMDGRRIVYCCRKGAPEREGGVPTFEICVMNADGTRQVQLTKNTIGDLTPTWSPDGARILFHRRVGGRGQFQLFMINADGTGEKQLTSPPGLSGFPNWGEALVPGKTR
jgi:Tol biopolymer transport system component